MIFLLTKESRGTVLFSKAIAFGARIVELLETYLTVKTFVKLEIKPHFYFDT